MSSYKTDRKLSHAMASGGEAIDVSAVDQTLTQPGALYVGSAGDVKVDMADGETLTFANLQVGFHPIIITKVYNADTTASSMMAVW